MRVHENEHGKNAVRHTRTFLPTLFQQTGIFIAGDAGGLEVVADDKHGNLAIGGDHHWSSRSFPHVRAAAAFLSGKSKTGFQDHLLQRAPVDWSEFRHDGKSGTNGCRAFLEADPVGTFPALAVVRASGMIERFFQRALVLRGDEKQVDRFVQRNAGLRRVRPKTRDIQRHGVRDELLLLPPDLHGAVDFHVKTLRRTYSAAQMFRTEPVTVELVFRNSNGYWAAPLFTVVSLSCV